MTRAYSGEVGVRPGRSPDNGVAAIVRTGSLPEAIKSAEEEIEEDTRILDRVENGAGPVFRIWRCDKPAVVIGRGQDASREVDIDYCRRHRIAVVRRGSGGGAVAVDPGTLQYAFALPYSLSRELREIASSKRFCNRIVRAALPATAKCEENASGDLVRGDRKVGGLALRRRRRAMLLHGTLLLSADLDLIAGALRHPSREPPYRKGRNHREFLTQLGEFDVEAFARRARELLAQFGQ